MRICIVAEVFLPKVDGVVVRTNHLIRQLAARGDDLLVICPQVEGARDTTVPIVEFPSFPLAIYPEYHVGIPDASLVDQVRRFAPDIIHFINPFAFGFRCCDVLTRHGCDVPTVFSFHTLYGEFVRQYRFLGGLSKLLWWVTRDYHNRADYNLTVSTIMQTQLTARGFRQVGFWPPAVDANLFHPNRKSMEMRSLLSGGRPDGPLLLTVSRLAPEKNVGFLAQVLPRIPNARLAIVGDGPQREELEWLFRGQAVTFVGYLKGEQLASAYASADAFIYASETETMGNVVLEAMAAGLPVVVPNAGGIPSLVEDGVTGFLYPPADTLSAAAYVQRLLDSDVLRVQLGNAAQLQVSPWDWANAAECVREIYQETVTTRTASPRTIPAGSRLAATCVLSLVQLFRAVAGIQSWQRRQLAPVHSLALSQQRTTL